MNETNKMVQTCTKNVKSQNRIKGIRMKLKWKEKTKKVRKEVTGKYRQRVKYEKLRKGLHSFEGNFRFRNNLSA